MSERKRTYKNIRKKYSKEERNTMLEHYKELETAFAKYKSALNFYNDAMKTNDNKQIGKARRSHDIAVEEYMTISNSIWEQYKHTPEKHLDMITLGSYVSSHVKD